jgi:hypothetical protein
LLSQIAQVFSSQGVVLPGTEFVPVRDRAKAACDHKGADCRCFRPKFDQASAKLELSRQGKALDAAKGEVVDGKAAQPAAKETEPKAEKALSDDEKKQVKELKQRDQDVRRHEQQHIASAGGYAGGANFEYEAGPDGRSYAVGGHVSIDSSPVSGNAQATLAKAEIVQRAALAPADPSGQDRAVASAAAQMAMEARQELTEEQGGEAEAASSGVPTPAQNLRGYAAGGAAAAKGVRFSAYA